MQILLPNAVQPKPSVATCQTPQSARVRHREAGMQTVRWGASLIEPLRDSKPPDEADVESESTSAEQLESQLETRRPQRRLGRLGLHRHRALRPQDSEGADDAQDDDAQLVVVAIAVADEPSV